MKTTITNQLRCGNKTATLVFGFIAVFSLFAQAQSPGKPATIVGQVIDTGCYFEHASKGPQHATCATVCAKQGIPLAILTADGKVYLPIAADHKNQNTKLLPFVEKNVKVTGTIIEKGGMNGIVMKTIEAAP